MLTRKQMLFLASASAAAGIGTAMNSGLMQMILKMHTDSAFGVGGIIGLGWLFGVILPPIVGALSDNTRTRFGRRMPYLMIFIPLGAVMLVVLSIFGVPSIIPRSPISFVLLAICAVLLSFFFKFWNAPYFALFPDLTAGRQRGEASAYMQIFSIIGTIAVFGMGAAFWDRSPILTLSILAAIVIISGAITIFLIKEPVESINARPVKKTGIAETAREFAHSKDYAKFMCSSVFWWFAMGILSTFFVSFATANLGLTGSSAMLMMGMFTILLIASAVPIGILGDRIGKKSVLQVGLLVAAFALTMVLFLSNIVLIYIMMAFIGMGFGVTVVLNLAITADLLPKGKEGKFMGIGNLFMALPNALASALGGLLIDAFGKNYRIIFIMAPIALVLGFFALRSVKMENKAKEAAAGR